MTSHLDLVNSKKVTNVSDKEFVLKQYDVECLSVATAECSVMSCKREYVVVRMATKLYFNYQLFNQNHRRTKCMG